jgi:cytochrome c oxidase assembly factor CtaG
VDDGIHALEHMLYLATATLFWWPIVARDPGARRLTYPGRVLYIFLSMPMMSLLGFVITYSDRVLYSHYIVAAGSVAAALADQRLGGTIMWESSMLGGATALSFVLVDWMRYDDAQARLADALSTRSAATAEVPGG